MAYLSLTKTEVCLRLYARSMASPTLRSYDKKVGLRLVRLDSTERCKLRFALSDVQNGLCSILTNVVLQQTANGSQRVRQGVLTVGRRAGGGGELCEGLVILQALRQVLCGFASRSLSIKLQRRVE